MELVKSAQSPSAAMQLLEQSPIGQQRNIANNPTWQEIKKKDAAGIEEYATNLKDTIGQFVFKK